MRSLAVVTMLTLCTSSARAEGGVPLSDADAYCDWVGNVGRSQSALLYSPQLYLNFGYVNGDDSQTGATTNGTSHPRLTAGVRYSLSELYQGAMTSKRAGADCARYRALSRLNSFFESARMLEARQALGAKVQVLEGAISHAEEIGKASAAATAAGYETVEQLNATQLKIDGLKAELSAARQALAIAVQRPEPPKGSIAQLRRERDSAERQLENVEGRLRRTQGWDLVLRGGYDRLFGVRDQLPLFGIVSVSFNPGWFAQHHYDHRAEDARSSFQRLDPIGADQRAEAILKQYEVIAKGEGERLQQTRVLLNDLERRMKAVEGLQGPRAASFRDYLWFDLIRLRAEAAYLEAHLREIEPYRGDRS